MLPVFTGEQPKIVSRESKFRNAKHCTLRVRLRVFIMTYITLPSATLVLMSYTCGLLEK